MYDISRNVSRISRKRLLAQKGLPMSAITRVETELIRVPLARTYKGSFYQMTHRSTVLLRIFTDDGAMGEAYVGDEDAGLSEIDSIIHQEIAPRLFSQDALAIEKCWEIARPATWNILRDRRLGLVASAAFDTALWDLMGRTLNIPLWKLWGGYRDSVPVISIGGYYNSNLTIEAEIEYLREKQFAGIKFKVGGLSPAEDAQRVRLARSVAGPDFKIAVDANQGWDIESAVVFARLVEDQDIMWFEEPCHWENDRRAMRDVRFRSGIAVCAGQTEMSAAGCRDLMDIAAIDYCNFDSSWSGGPTEWLRAAAVAATYGVKMAHHEEAQVSAHLIASQSHGTFIEFFHPDRDPIWHNMIANATPLNNGYMALPTGPGLGWELDRGYIAAHRISERTTKG